MQEAPSWEVRLLLERAAELERLQRYEEALVLYHRGKQRAPLVAAFQEGVQRASKAVDAAIGQGSPRESTSKRFSGKKVLKLERTDMMRCWRTILAGTRRLLRD